MFYRSTEHLKAQLEASLRTAAEFATLGEYQSGRPARTVSRKTPQRVFLFAKVSPRCPHSADAPRACGRRTGPRRGGTVKVVPQPCTLAHEPRS